MAQFKIVFRENIFTRPNPTSSIWVSGMQDVARYIDIVGGQTPQEKLRIAKEKATNICMLGNLPQNLNVKVQDLSDDTYMPHQTSFRRTLLGIISVTQTGFR